NIQKRGEVARVVGHVVLIRAGFGKAVTALVIKNDAEVGREDLRDLAPDAEVATERVDEHDRRRVAAALVAIVDDEAVRLHKPHRARSLHLAAALDQPDSDVSREAEAFEPPRRPSRTKVHQYQSTAIGAPMSITASRPGSESKG